MRTLHPLLFLVVGAVGMAPRWAAAHPDDYINETFVFQTIERGETELEVWVDGQQAARGDDLDRLYTLAVERGLTDRWMADAAVQLVHDMDGVAFGRLRAETRVRFADEDAWPVDLALSVEYELETARLGSQGESEHVVTPRLVLSRDLVPRFNTTINLDVPVRIGPDAGVSFAYAIGIRYPARAIIRIGAELRHDLGNHAAQVFPQVWLQPRENLAVKLGLGVGLTKSAERLIARLAVELEI